ncbi:hypothetical protein EGI88_02070 [Empedobacter falsenii]|uniref:Uncharacterized protein n=2 Tax=Empedobacter falsenii TaxID=343874 RepID=A0A3R8UEW8_9FLAO|nr:hypothetical protein EGI89_02065 [Empedobacter falsenii]RRT94368.1 hypothetical protein EGI88_02070 [Empedobacter falsenii]
MVADWVDPKNYYGISGRATAKTTDLQAKRSMRISYNMARAYFAWVADTYENAIGNVRDGLIEGWNRNGWEEGVHYVLDERPPKHFEKPYKSPKSYKHTMSINNGCFFKIVSLAQPSSAAGNSYQHLFGDEVKYFNEDKLKKLTPAIRGEYTRFSESIYYRGRTFTTDMPNPVEGEFDWILQQEKNMDVEQIKLIISIFVQLNECRKDYFRAVKFQDQLKLKSVERRLVKLQGYYNRARKDSTLFMIGSTFANLEILSLGYFEDTLEGGNIEDFKTAIMSLKPGIPQGAKFYTNLGTHHFFEDGLKLDFIDNYSLHEEFKPTAKNMRFEYYDPQLPVSAGMDFGDMISMVTGQERGNYIYALKNIFAVPDENDKFVSEQSFTLNKVAKEFVEFYKGHKNKTLYLFYDRSGNAYQNINRDWANDTKVAIERAGQEIGEIWEVELMSRGQAKIDQAEEYRFMTKYLSEGIAGIPDVRIYKNFNKELKSSLEITKIKVRKNSKGETVIEKNKSSESLPYRLRPMYSTNFSDAFKYWLMRRDWRMLSKTNNSESSIIPDVGIF